eukprot:4811763-Ditylum_brightwellii.AAC.1
MSTLPFLNFSPSGFSAYSPNSDRSGSTSSFYFFFYYNSTVADPINEVEAPVNHMEEESYTSNGEPPLQ